MRGLHPLVADFVTRITGDELLSVIFGEDPRAYTERPPESASMPYVVIEPVNMLPWGHQSLRGTLYTMQLSAFMPRDPKRSSQGISDVARVAERLRDIFDDVHNIDIGTSPDGAQAPSLKLDFDDGAYQENTGTHRLIRRQYDSGAVLPDPDGLSYAAVVRFECVVSG